MWPFHTLPDPQPCFKIGQYQLNAAIEDRKGIVPLSTEELNALGSQVEFQGEEIVHAPSAQFAGVEWDTILGTVNGHIYKIAIQWTGARAAAGRINRLITVECSKRYRNASRKNLAIWDTSDGNLVLDSSNFGDRATVNVFATSRKVASFARLTG